jgi:hypothetical protein
VEIHDFQARPASEELSPAPEAARAHPAVRRQVREGLPIVRDEEIPGIRAWRDGCDRQPGDEVRRQVLQAVHREVDAAAEECVLDPFRECPLAVI